MMTTENMVVTTGDMELVREYVSHNSEEAFATLVSRYVNLVYSVALRQLRDTQLAEEATQAAFIILARKAASLGPKTVLPAWLCRTAQYVAFRALRTQRRRQSREQEVYVQSLLNQPEPESPPWPEIAPLLDIAMARLGEKDHSAIVLRYFEGKNLKQVAAALGVNENAAKTRVSRAVEKLRAFFVQRGVVLSAAAITVALSTNSVQAAPAALTKAVIAVAAGKGLAAGGSTLTLIKGAIKLMAWTKAQTAAAAAVVILLATGTTVVLVRHPSPTQNTQAPWPKALPTASQIAQANPGLPELQIAAKTLVFSAMARKTIPEAANWCESLNSDGRLWPVTPTNTFFALNSQMAGRSFSRGMNGDTVLFFQTSNPGWNQTGGPELLANKSEGVAVGFLDGRALIVPPGDVTQLRWTP
ncbi:MAG: sigma-70 family RNA polymerase sigma factor [Verrucomicrobiota bacterium]|jgi:RNA polymerase sigma factor (sigma-70 family)